MTNLITSKMIEETKAFKNYPVFQQKLLLKRENRVKIERAFIHYNATGCMMPQIGQKNIEILIEIVDKDNESL